MSYFLRILSILLTLTLGYLQLTAQEAFLEEPFHQWSRAEVTQLLNDSAWAKTQAVRLMRRRQPRAVAGQVNADPQTTSTADRQAMLGGAADPMDFRFTIRLRSSLPIRRAIVRLLQLESGYDRMPAGEKKSIDGLAKELLECRECRDNYIVTVGFGSPNSQVNLVYDWFKGQTVESLKGYIYLANDHGQRRELSKFIPPKVPGDEAFFFFSRLDQNGKPLVTGADKKLHFRMSDTNAGSVTNFTLDVQRMKIAGTVEF